MFEVHFLSHVNTYMSTKTKAAHKVRGMEYLEDYYSKVISDSCHSNDSALFDRGHDCFSWGTKPLCFTVLLILKNDTISSPIATKLKKKANTTAEILRQ